MEPERRFPNVLLVEDVDLLRSVLGEFLEDLGFSVRTAGSCAAARKAIAAGRVDIVVSDIRMPDGSGIDLCEGLLRQHPRLGVVLMTGFPNETVPPWVYERDIPLVPKPLDMVGLADSISQVAARLGFDSFKE